MRLSDILEESRVIVDRTGAVAPDKAAALGLLAARLAPPLGAEVELVEQALVERERVQSTGIGDGVGIPHAYLDAAAGQVAGLLLVPQGIAFDSDDRQPVRIVFGVVGPRRETGAHLKVLARISRLLRDAATRERLCTAPDAATAFAIVCELDAAIR